jgi:CHAT domain-containing protein
MKKLRAQPEMAAILGALASWLLLACQVTGTVESEDGEGAPARQEAVVEALRRDPGPEHPETLIAIARLIELRTASGDVDGGRPLFEEILAIPPLAMRVLTRIAEPNEPGIEIAGILGGLGELEAARTLLEEMLARYQPMLGRENFVSLALLEALARVHLAREDTPAAIAVLDRLRQLSEQSLGSEHADTVRARDNLAWALRHADVKTARDLPAASDYLGVLDALERQPNEKLPGEDRYFLNRGMSQMEELTHVGIDRLLRLNDVTGAFEALEHRRATGVLSDLQSGTSLLARLRRAGDASGAGAGGGADLQKLAARINAITRALDRLDETGRRQEALLTERARLQWRRHRRLQRGLQMDQTVELYRPMTPDDIRASFDPGTVLLSYAVGQQHTDLFVITSDAPVTWHRLPVSREELRHQIESLDRSLGLGQRSVRPLRPGAGEPREALARWLFDTLMAPAGDRMASAQRLLILPDGPLYRLPFAALVRPAEGGRTQYLVEWKPLHQVQSIAVYAELLGRRPAAGAPRRGNRGLVALGDPVYPASGGVASNPAASRGSRCAAPAYTPRALRRPLPSAVRSAARRGLPAGLDPLPCTAREVRAIDSLFAEASQPRQTFLAEDATEETGKRQLKEARYVHLAVHGFADPEQPDHSYLALTIPQDLSEGCENGILEAWEIVDQLQLDADLVTLAACVTALGPELSGEGLMSLSFAFQIAGARSVLASLWSVDDESTAELMTRFYRYLLAGVPKAEALRAAQSELIRGPIPVQSQAGGIEMRDFTDPYYWAAFQLIGDWQ